MVFYGFQKPQTAFLWFFRLKMLFLWFFMVHTHFYGFLWFFMVCGHHGLLGLRVYWNCARHRVLCQYAKLPYGKNIIGDLGISNL